MNTYTESQLDDLMYSPEYAEYIMKHGDRPCYNGDMLLDLQEEGYLFEEFIAQLKDWKWLDVKPLISICFQSL